MTEQPTDYIVASDLIEEMWNIGKGFAPEGIGRIYYKMHQHPVSTPPKGAAPETKFCINMGRQCAYWNGSECIHDISDGEADCFEWLDEHDAAIRQASIESERKRYACDLETIRPTKNCFSHFKGYASPECKGCSQWGYCADITIRCKAAREEVMEKNLALVRDVISKDQSGLAEALSKIQTLAKGYDWIPNGEWGNYDYTQRTAETLQRECGYLLTEIEKIAYKGLLDSGNRVIAHVRSCEESLYRSNQMIAMRDAAIIAEERAKLLKLLEPFEWSGMHTDYEDSWGVLTRACPFCFNAKKDGHKPDCLFIKFLASNW